MAKAAAAASSLSWLTVVDAAPSAMPLCHDVSLKLTLGSKASLQSQIFHIYVAPVPVHGGVVNAYNKPPDIDIGERRSRVRVDELLQDKGVHAVTFRVKVSDVREHLATGYVGQRQVVLVFEICERRTFSKEEPLLRGKTRPL